MPVVLLRHGPTSYNTKDGHERIRGWLDLPLTPDGQRIAVDAAQKLSHLPITKVLSSDLQRAADTARMLSITTNAPLSVHPELRPWNLGTLTGQHSNDVQPLIDKLAASADTPAPGGGESFNQFLQRFIPFILPHIAGPDLVAVVSHIRNIKALEAFLEGGGTQMDMKKWKEEPKVETGEAILATMKGFQKIETPSRTKKNEK